MDKFTIEQIEKAVLPDKGDWSAIKAALTKPEWKPEVKQVMAYTVIGRELWRYVAYENGNLDKEYEYRPLTIEEAGIKEFVPMDVFVKLRDALKDIASRIKGDGIADDTPAAIAELAFRDIPKHLRCDK